MVVSLTRARLPLAECWVTWDLDHTYHLPHEVKAEGTLPWTGNMAS